MLQGSTLFQIQHWCSRNDRERRWPGELGARLDGSRRTVTSTRRTEHWQKTKKMLTSDEPELAAVGTRLSVLR